MWRTIIAIFTTFSHFSVDLVLILHLWSCLRILVSNESYHALYILIFWAVVTRPLPPSQIIFPRNEPLKSAQNGIHSEMNEVEDSRKTEIFLIVKKFLTFIWVTRYFLPNLHTQDSLDRCLSFQVNLPKIDRLLCTMVFTIRIFKHCITFVGFLKFSYLGSYLVLEQFFLSCPTLFTLSTACWTKVWMKLILNEISFRWKH